MPSRLKVSHSESITSLFTLSIPSGSAIQKVRANLIPASANSTRMQFGGLSLIADPTGIVLDTADSKTEKLLFAEIDRDKVIEARRRFPILRDRRPDLYGPIAEETEDVIERA